MNTQNLSSKEIYSFGFKNAKKHFWSFLVLFLVYLVASFIFMPKIKEDETISLFQGILYIIGYIISIYLMMSMYSATLKIVRGYEVKMKDFFTWPKTCLKTLWTCVVSVLVLLPAIFVGGLLFGFLGAFGLMAGNAIAVIIAIIIGLVLLIITVHLAIRVSFSKYYTLDTGSWAIASIKKSFELTKGRVWSLLGLVIIGLLIEILGLIAIFIGLLWAIPTVLIAQVYIYHLLMGGKENQLMEDRSVAPIVPQPSELPARSLANGIVADSVINNPTA